MKTKLNPIVAVAIALMAMIAHASAKGAESQLPVGSWIVTFNNGVVENCQIAADGTVKVSEPKRSATGKATLNNGVVEIAYEDDRLERWSLRDGEMAVEHWHAVAKKAGKRPAMGVAQKSDEIADLEVHEWGTFTVLQGSNGQVIKWYQAPNKLVDLPPFVQRTGFFGGKSGTFNLASGLDNVRMETPVLYFYPEKQMDITVTAGFPEGRITEVFPPAAINRFSTITWRGTLLAPDSPELKKVPVAAEPLGRHYAAARAVPEAWLFRNKPLPTPFSRTPEPVVKKPTPVYKPHALQQALVEMALISDKQQAATAPPKIEPIDHFIFYRGAGNRRHFELTAHQLNSPNTFVLTNSGQATIPKLFALQVVGGKSSFVSVEQLKTFSSATDESPNQPEIHFPDPDRSADEVAVELRAEMIAALHAEGLTKAEAAAMVATWDDLWFIEPGTRVLAVLPQSIADAMVPLTITPKPKKIERVFVARLELITRETEAILTSVLNPVAKPENIADDAKKFASLQLGRYAAGGMERARTILSNQVNSRFQLLEHEWLKQQKLQAATAIKKAIAE
ncbi:MAG: hypothetical protein ACI8XO_000123 [Verrucomicrobiales bacterium]|jgi:hypothetical protein